MKPNDDNYATKAIIRKCSNIERMRAKTINCTLLVIDGKQTLAEILDKYFSVFLFRFCLIVMINVFVFIFLFWVSSLVFRLPDAYDALYVCFARASSDYIFEKLHGIRLFWK